MQNDPKKIHDEIEQLKKEKKGLDKGFFIGLVICFIINCLISLMVLLYELYSLKSPWNSEKWTILSDTFSVSGGFMILIYLLVWASGAGAFDAIVYASKLAFFTTFYKNVRETKLPKTYADYREIKRGKEKMNVNFMLISGGLFLIIGLILLIPYSLFR